MDFQELNNRLPGLNPAALEASQTHWDHIAKPLKGLGMLEELVSRIAGLTGQEAVRLSKRAVLVFCADNGVVAEGVTQTDASVTATMAGVIRDHGSTVCRMAAAAGADVFPVDMGMLVRVPGVAGCHLGDGTGNIAQGPAMTLAQAEQGIAYGMELARQYRDQGYDILVTGEMGIGNTTTSSAIASVLLGLPVETVTGRGAGLSDAGLARKKEAIRRAIQVNAPNPADPLDVLAKVGGFDIAAMVGLYLGGALYRVPIVIDGLISSIAALIAARLCPKAVSAMIPSHSSAEPAAQAILKELGLSALIYGGLKLGEGTGAVCMLPLLDMALCVYDSGRAFADTPIGQYEPQGGESR